MHNVTFARGILRLPLLVATALLGGCQSLGMAVGDAFTFEGDLPADFKLRAQAHYDVSNRDSCVGRPRKSQTFENDFQPTPQHYHFRIPVSYYDGTCHLQLNRVGLYVHGRYGETYWDRDYDNGQLLIEQQLPAGAPGFDAHGVLHKEAKCEWLFKLSAARSRLGQLEKLLSCKGAGAYLPFQDLSGKTVRLDIRLNAEEKPAYKNTWVRLPEGWRLCEPRPGEWRRCQNPPTFRTFKMNGRECTVYPNCTE